MAQAIGFKVRIQHIIKNPVIFKPIEARRVLIDNLELGMNAATEIILNAAAKRAPLGATGDLSLSFQTRVLRFDKSVKGLVLNNAPYALIVETGSKPHFAPIAPLKYWAMRVLHDESAAYAIQRSIAKKGTSSQSMKLHGTKGYEFFGHPTSDQPTLDLVNQALDASVNRAVREIKDGGV